MGIQRTFWSFKRVTFGEIGFKATKSKIWEFRTAFKIEESFLIDTL